MCHLHQGYLKTQKTTILLSFILTIGATDVNAHTFISPTYKTTNTHSHPSMKHAFVNTIYFYILQTNQIKKNKSRVANYCTLRKIEKKQQINDVKHLTSHIYGVITPPHQDEEKKRLTIHTKTAFFHSAVLPDVNITLNHTHIHTTRHSRLLNVNVLHSPGANRRNQRRK